MNEKKPFQFLFFMIYVFLIAAIITLIPNPNASKDCLLHFHAVCSFTPISTLICIACAVILFIMRKRKPAKVNVMK